MIQIYAEHLKTETTEIRYEDVLRLEIAARDCQRAAKAAIAAYRHVKSGALDEDVVYLSQAEHLANLEDIMKIRVELWRTAQSEYREAKRAYIQ